MALLRAENLVSGYGETEILHGISISVEPEEIVVIIGPNGAGKSTLIKTIIGILQPKEGRVLYNGMDVTGLPPEQLALLGMAYVPQMSNIFPSLTVRENLEMGAIVKRPGLLTRIHRRLLNQEGPASYTPEEFEAKVDRILDIFPNLAPKLRERAGLLSGGEQQMVALARTLVLEPRILLIDEPSAGLAPRLVQSIFDKIVDINATGTAILLVEQNARRALEMAHRGYVLDMGNNRFEGEGEALLRDPEVGRLYLGG
jgi:ABC-type branched-subunit amino acid transport system ATPase component